MKRLKDVCTTAVSAIRSSFAFCLRNDRKDTLLEMMFSLGGTVISYFIIISTGHLVSALQAHLAGHTGQKLTMSEFVESPAFYTVGLLVALLFGEVVANKFDGAYGSRRRAMLRIANNRESNALIASLDIGRKRSRMFDDLHRKICELPVGYYTRIEFANEIMELFGMAATLLMFGIPLAFHHPVYVAIIMATAVPMIFAESAAVGRSWKLQMELVPVHKKRSVLEQAFRGTTSFLQGVMFNQHPVLTEQIKANQEYVLAKNDEMRWANIQLTLLAYMVSMAGLCFVFMHAAWATLSTAGDIGALTVIVFSSRRLQGSMRAIVGQMASQWINAKGVVMIEKEFFGLKPLLVTEQPVMPEFEGPPAVRFDHVTFSYPDKDVAVLKDISFTIAPGSKVAIVGKNGSGKSSLIGLLMRYYDPTGGSIHVGDLSLRTIEPRVWNRTITALLQQYAIDDRTIGEEIASSRLGEPIDRERLAKAAALADFMKIVEEDPKGFDSQIGTEFDGREFSGGEEQRLALSRVFYRGAPILILDEPDAALDPEGAQRIIDNAFALTGVTLIMVTQHVSRAERCDQILVLDKGELVESGTHSELGALDGRYAAMLRKDKRRMGIEE